MSALYNENDRYQAEWLRNLIAAGHIAAGDVDERSIHELTADDVSGRSRVHLFAGIGGWEYALRLAGWPEDRPVWTGSCPCQPFSGAGKREGFQDERHLWPEMLRLIRAARPPVVFGEQVASALEWLDLVSGDLEGEGYSFGAVVLGAHSVGAPHIRQRIYWVAYCDNGGREGERVSGILVGERAEHRNDADGRGSSGVADSKKRGHGEYQRDTRAVGPAGEERESEKSETRRATQATRDCREDGLLGDPDDEGLEGFTGRRAIRPGSERASTQRASPWSDPEWLPCRDGKQRPTQPGLFPLAHGVSGRVGRLRAYGNAIVPQVAAAFVSAFMEATA